MLENTNVLARDNCAVTILQYLGAKIINEGSRSEVPSGATQTMTLLTRLKTLFRNHIIMNYKISFMRALVFYIFLYACEIWTLKAELQGKTLYFDHITNEQVHRTIQRDISPMKAALSVLFMWG
ncbi:hypothetical protein PoB_006789200 [Plakobranchus ocellatus]|uniref:Uncharacterized protein n=1 Tax=Plakobranchus ocellatus TaxID=259542 RepID=A0AAV4DAU6_9GAST|nr:hypothetical protein PoB_006789200 [Plakobranchus ocellatus]